MVNDKDNIEPKRRKGLFGSRKAAVAPPAPVAEPAAVQAPVARQAPVETPAQAAEAA